MFFMRKTTALPTAAEALPGRATPIATATSHFVNGRRLQPPYPAGLEQAVFALGCFWGAERKFWELGDGITTTAIAPSGEFYFAEDYHQQYLAKNPSGYCGLGGTGVSCPIGAGVAA